MTPGSVNSIVENIGEIFVERAKITFGTFCSTKSRPRHLFNILLNVVGCALARNIKQSIAM
jgi:hypothetical protein